ncbi:hypothetical protein V866_001251 [Kwoniella sp. B9012]
MSEPQKQNNPPKRTYRACYPCRSRKLKCDFGDPNSPNEGPCQRCRREGRECEKVQPTVIIPSKRQRLSIEPASFSSAQPTSSFDNSASYDHMKARSNPGLSIVSHPAVNQVVAPVMQHENEAEDQQEAESTGQDDEHHALLTSNIQNPHEALQLLASATNSNSRHNHRDSSSPTVLAPRSSRTIRERKQIWLSWEPVQEGLLTIQEAENLLTFFEVEMSPLYPVYPKEIFSPTYLNDLVAKESFSLGAMLAIAARYSVLLVDGRDEEVHIALSRWLREQMLYLMDGDTSLRSISTVEALLVLSEWPLLPLSRGKEHDESASNDEYDSTHLLLPSLRYDQHSWSQIGWAVRIAQELGLHNRAFEAVLLNRSETWENSRMLKTWIYCYNADRQNAVLQNYMSAQWWEQVSDLVSRQVRDRGAHEVWVDDAFAQSLVACLIGTIQEHLYPNKEVTRSILRTGVWESFLRSLRLELQFIKRSCQSKLKEKGVDAVMLQVEIDYVTLYANALALRALQEKLKRRREAKDMYYTSPSLLNLVEGPWILEALAAARSIVQLTVDALTGKGYLRYCPSRIFQRVVFAATFLFKALALGVVEHGQQTVLELLGKVIDCLRRHSCDEQHLPSSFAELLDRLHEHRQSLSTSRMMDRSDTVDDHLPHLVNIFSSSNGPMTEPTTVQAPNESGKNLSQNDNQSSIEVRLDSLFSTLISEQTPPIAPCLQDATQPNYSLTHDPTLPHLNAGEVSWEFAPEQFLPTVDRDQDAMLQSLWNLDSVDPTSLNLWDTLFGDTDNRQADFSQPNFNTA